MEAAKKAETLVKSTSDEEKKPVGRDIHHEEVKVVKLKKAENTDLQKNIVR